MKDVEARALLARLEQALGSKPATTSNSAALEQAVTDHDGHVDTLIDRLRFMDVQERRLRTMLFAAHKHLIEHGATTASLREELVARGGVIEALHQAVQERTAWAERMVAEAEARGRVIEGLQREIESLRQAVQERTAWAERMVAEAEARSRRPHVTPMQAGPVSRLIRWCRGYRGR